MSEPTPATLLALPYPHARNDCDGCRERDAEMRAHYEGLQGRDLRWCQRCAGSAMEGLVLMGLTVTVTPREEQHG